MSTAQAELETLQQLLQLEKEQDYEQFRRFVSQLSLSERVSEGYTWHPVTLEKSGYTYGERAYVTISRASSTGTQQAFRPGQPVRLFNRADEVRQPEQTGVIHSMTATRMRVVLSGKDLPDWLHTGSLGVDLSFDERTYREMEKALVRVREASGDQLAVLREIVHGNRAARFREQAPLTVEGLNPSQEEAVRQVLAAEDIAVVHGPPGTGKTTTLVAAIRLICRSEQTVLVCAPSNTATDLLTERLSAEGLSVLRIGDISRVDENLVRHTLEAQLANHPEAKNIRKVRLEAAETRRKALRYKRKFGADERQERGRLFKEAGELSAWANRLEDMLVENLLDSSQVITCTLVGSMHKALGKRRFRTLVIDEAAQALEPATWIPLTRADRVILAGDPFQLPPTVKSTKAVQGGLSTTLMEKCLTKVRPVSLLTVQYRMHRSIMQFSNHWFYQGRLYAADPVAEHQLAVRLPHPPLLFIDTAGTGFEEKSPEKSRSRYNPEEFRLLCEHLYQLLALHEGMEPPSIGIIAPYREQVLHMVTATANDPTLKDVKLDINTIDAFQGQERDVIYLSLVRSNPKGDIGFLADYRRMNVAMTRARKLLVLVGDSATIGHDPFYRELLDFCELSDSYQTAWAYMM
ncbi:MAG: hypothetical protein RLY31_2308 [Bacteroidota bacterium]|jgi:superfamily I DNA and/or RNA helicase